MKYDGIAKIVQIKGTDILNVDTSVNAYLSPEYGWQLLDVLQIATDTYSCPVFILGHSDIHAEVPWLVQP